MNVLDRIVKQGTLALAALKDYEENKKGAHGKKKFLFPEQEAALFLVAKYKKAALKKAPVHRRFISLPFPERNPDNTAVCLILPDLDRSRRAKRDADVDAQAREWAEILKEKFGFENANIAKTKILTMTQLTREYGQHVDKAKLANTYDLFLVDNAIMVKVFNFLGASFQKPGKMLLPVHAHRNTLAKEIERSYTLVNLPVEALMDGVSVRIGNLQQQTVEQLAANLRAIVEKLLVHAPGDELNIRSCYLQLSGTKASLPIYVDFGSANEVKLEGSKKRHHEEIDDECSTLPEGLAVRVCANGDVVVIDEKTREEVVYPTPEDEWEPRDDLKPRDEDITAEVKKRAKQRLKEECQRPSMHSASGKSA